MSDAALSRRELLARSGLVAGGAVLLGSGVLGAGRVLAQDAPRPAFPEPPVRRAAGRTLATRLRVGEAEVPIATQTARAVVYESGYPGPTLELAAGDRLAIDLVNDATVPTNLHTHGLHVDPQQPGDDVLLNIAPGDTYPYRYDIPADHPGGTYWYHAHRHLLSDNQVFGGLFGLLIVRGELDRLPGIAGLEEHALIMAQMQIVDGAVARADASSLSDQVTLVNGHYQPVVKIAPGQTQRWRLLNTSSVFLRLQLDGHPLHVIGIDGNALPRTQARDLLELPPGGRADVLVRPSAAGTFELRSRSWDDLGVFYTSMVPVPQTVARMEVSGDPVAPAPLPTALLAVDDLRDVRVDRRRTFRLEEREPRGVGPLDAFEYYINGRLFDHTRVDVQIPLNATEEWTFRNLTYEPHPLHIHVNPFQVVAIDGDRDRGEPFHRDSALIPPFGTLTIRHRFLDYTGRFVMHCHILFHEDHGMMQILEVYGQDGPGPRRIDHEGH